MNFSSFENNIHTLASRRQVNKMSVNGYSGLLEHFGHQIEIIGHGEPDKDLEDICIVCMDCNTILMCFENLSET